MSRKIWKDHPMFGKRLTYRDSAGSFEADVIDVKCGPMLIDTSTFDQPEAKIDGTIKLHLKPVNGRASFWTAPMIYKGEDKT